MHRHLAFLLALVMIAGISAAASMDRNIMVPPVVDEIIEINVNKGDTLHYSFDVIDPEGACVDFSERPAFGNPLNQPCVTGSSNTRQIQDSGRYKLIFTNKGSESVAVHLTYSVTPGQTAGPVQEQDAGCSSAVILLMVAGATLFVSRTDKTL